MTCRSFGDPHITTFAGNKCDLMSLGVLPLVELPGMRVQAFHCATQVGGPTAGNAGVVLLAGSDLIMVVGSTVSINGQSVAQGISTVGSTTFEVKANGAVLVRLQDGSSLTSIRRNAQQMTSGAPPSATPRELMCTDELLFSLRRVLPRRDDRGAGDPAAAADGLSCERVRQGAQRRHPAAARS